MKHWIVIKNHEIIISKKNQGLPQCSEVNDLSPYFLRQIDLGIEQGMNYLCAELETSISLPENFYALPLRQAFTLFSESFYSLLVKGYSLILWDKNHQFCGRCGKETLVQAKGFERKCFNCDLSLFPRISPSVIVLIKRGKQLLMARSPHFLPGVYALIAGFVEVGESLEEAAKREVMEEVGLSIKNLTYFGSQPWPFPDSLMTGFIADYASGEIVMDEIEIEDAGWYSYDSLPGRPSTNLSLGAKMIDAFIASCEASSD